MTSENEVILGEDGQPISKSALKKLQKQKEKDEKKKAVEAKLVGSIDLGRSFYSFRRLKRRQERLLILYAHSFLMIIRIYL